MIKGYGKYGFISFEKELPLSKKEIELTRECEGKWLT
jgi:hypothetical protein